jgi:hypothetical protein
MHKLTSAELSVAPGGWISIDGHASMGPTQAHGTCGPAKWSLRFAADEPGLSHLSPRLLYRAPLPRTKLSSPAPAARFDGIFELEGRSAIELRDWRGMIGHNWGSEHAERWIWLHGIDFREDERAWLDVALGRILIAGRMTPWVANGAISLEGRRRRIGGLRARGLRVAEGVEGCELELSGEHGLRVGVHAEVPAGSAAGWRYADPDGSEHDVVNCSIASLRLELRSPGEPLRVLHSDHGGAYELGMRERDHGVALAPFPDG